MKRAIYGVSVRGAGHIRNGIECQDSCRFEELSETIAVLAAADGHGSSKYPFSRIGSRIAADVFCDCMKDIVKSSGGDSGRLRSYLSREGSVRISCFLAADWRRRVMTDHIESGRAPEVTEPGPEAEKEICRLYGTTLLGLLLTTEFIFAFQIGDGDIVFADREGVQYAVEAEKHLGVETDSLSSADAWKKSAASLLPAPNENALPCMYLLSTDGLLNSHMSADEYKKSCMAYFEAAKQFGFGKVAENLGDWLTETSEKGCGDDITVVMAYFDRDRKETRSRRSKRRRARRKRGRIYRYSAGRRNRQPKSRPERSESRN